MKPRKVSLLAAIVVLGCAFALELALDASDSIKTLTLSEKPDSILIEKGDGASLLLSKDGDRWLAGDKKYPTDSTRMDSMVEAIQTVKILDSVSSGGDDERYGFGGSDGITITAKIGDKELRRIEVGKAATTSQQSYARLDGKEEVILVSGNLKRTFGVGLDELRDKTIFTFKPSDPSGIALKGKETYTLEKSGTPEEWSVSGKKDFQLDKEKLDTWLSGLIALKASSYAEEDSVPQGDPLEILSFKLDGREATVTIHKKADDTKYLCSSSESPYPFYLSSYLAERYMKPLSELEAK